MVKKREDMRVEEIREWVDYNPDTGEFVWKPGKHWRPNIGAAFVGKPAGTWHKGKRNLTAYLYISIHRKKYAGHRIAWALQTGEWPERNIDHIDGDGRNNRWDNLRQASVSENHKNSPKQRNNTSGVTGVSYRKDMKKWYAYIHHPPGKMISLGFYDKLEDSIAARKAAEKEYGYHENHGR